MLASIWHFSMLQGLINMIILVAPPEVVARILLSLDGDTALDTEIKILAYLVGESK